ncbi:MAG TPA: hypothetical protein VF958_07265, partial [Thermoanaerobaculia bacterium]
MRERHAVTVGAPAAFVLDVARNFDPQSIPAVRVIFAVREKVMGARVDRGDLPTGLVPWTLAMGWGALADEPGRFFVAGAACQPWKADVDFMPIPSERFASYAEPDRVKIAWTLETEPLGPGTSRFASETRAVATDSAAREKFRRYWRFARFGIVAIRWLLRPGVRREAERRGHFREADRPIDS